MKMIVIAALGLAATPLLAEVCPPAPDHSERLSQLIADVQAAPNEMAGREVSNLMWDVWADAPDDRAQSILDRGLKARQSYDFDTAYESFDELVAYCPDYAEGYNQRAFIAFIRQDYDAALVDLDLAIERSPRHIAAIAGRALTLIGLKRDDEAQVALRQALALNPWLSERRFLTEPDGQEL